ncbi:hypothetical protein DAPPUDRAFT_234740 [Daphnia pulex]|uniref:Uncharacterized protein n=1 Tax=Daphnia pulex TaxID=6669 RepID=E9FXA6_DAPPU|nr:hypothetical protein DAPPUDRAFT_234740 [Daphnia pulex]|eukprot:EFX88046.1 hypothetical protein DAPPUDRAFT_234740 [Daphnia pulex]
MEIIKLCCRAVVGCRVVDGWFSHWCTDVSWVWRIRKHYIAALLHNLSTTSCYTDAPQVLQHHAAPSYYTESPQEEYYTEAPQHYTNKAPEYYTATLVAPAYYTEVPPHHTTRAPEYHTITYYGMKREKR